MRALLTDHQWRRFGDRFRAAAPAVTFLVMDAEGTVRDGDDAVERTDLSFEIGFGSTDLFDGADGPQQARRYFGALAHDESLAWLHMAAAGVDSPFFESILERGVRLTTSHHTATPISEYVLAQVLRQRLPLAAMDASQRAHDWTKHDWDEVADSRWLIVGMGAIGAAVATRARAFGAHVTGVRRHPEGAEPVDTMIRPGELRAALGDHDVIVLAVPATRHTSGMVDDAFLSATAPGTILVNIGRGALVDEDALRRSLEHGRPAIAVLDVALEEPLPPDHWMWDHPSVVVTAHTSAGGLGRYERAASIFCDNLARYVAGRPLADEITAIE